jgi:hypothetical protein
MIGSSMTNELKLRLNFTALLQEYFIIIAGLATPMFIDSTLSVNCQAKQQIIRSFTKTSDSADALLNSKHLQPTIYDGNN